MKLFITIAEYQHGVLPLPYRSITWNHMGPLRILLRTFAPSTTSEFVFNSRRKHPTKTAFSGVHGEDSHRIHAWILWDWTDVNGNLWSALTARLISQRWRSSSGRFKVFFSKFVGQYESHICLPGKKGMYRWLGGGFKYFLFTPLPGEMIQFD